MAITLAVLKLHCHVAQTAFYFQSHCKHSSFSLSIAFLDFIQALPTFVAKHRDFSTFSLLNKCVLHEILKKIRFLRLQRRDVNID